MAIFRPFLVARKISNFFVSTPPAPQKTRNFRTWWISKKNDKILCTFFAHCEKCKFVDCGFRFSFRDFYPRISRAQNVQNLQNLQISEKLGQKSAGFGPKFSPQKRQIHTVIFCGRRKKIQKKPLFPTFLGFFANFGQKPGVSRSKKTHLSLTKGPQKPSCTKIFQKFWNLQIFCNFCTICAHRKSGGDFPGILLVKRPKNGVGLDGISAPKNTSCKKNLGIWSNRKNFCVQNFWWKIMGFSSKKDDKIPRKKPPIFGDFRRKTFCTFFANFFKNFQNFQNFQNFPKISKNLAENSPEKPPKNPRISVRWRSVFLLNNHPGFRGVFPGFSGVLPRISPGVSQTFFGIFIGHRVSFWKFSCTHFPGFSTFSGKVRGGRPGQKDRDPRENRAPKIRKMWEYGSGAPPRILLVKLVIS